MNQHAPCLARSLALAVFFTASAAAAQPVGWSSIDELTITETSGTTLSAYDVPVTFDSRPLITGGALAADGADLRFIAGCDDATELPYWIEPGTMNTDTTRVWVKVPSIAASASRIVLMVYGNPAAPPMSTQAVLEGPLSSTNQVTGGSPGGTGNSQRGFRFRTRVPIVITQFGKNEPTGTTRFITLFDEETQSIVLQRQVSGAASQYVYSDLVSPLVLPAGHVYLLEMFQGPADGYLFGPPGVVNAALQYLDMRYCNNCTQDTYPQNFLQNVHYGYPDMTIFAPSPRASSEVMVVRRSGCTDSLACDADCTPRVCGDGVINAAAGEECDDANADDTDACPTTCRAATCGDGFVQAGVEQCDDANVADDDGCLSTCVSASCGDGFVHLGAEQCDDGNNVDTDACTSACAPASCGDGIVQDGVEGCDDANADDTDACLSTCLNASCGDGFLWAGLELCDDGNTADTDGCRADCTEARCGDGVTRNGIEECDDGNASSADGCTNGCILARCGDGIVRAGVESCDDGNAADTDACLRDCTTARCGDGIVNVGGEGCEDGNTNDGDACTNACALARCGDGIVFAGVEGCDDGNTAAEDGCSSSCQVEVASPLPDPTNPDDPLSDGSTTLGGGGCNATHASGGLGLLWALVAAACATRRARSRWR